MRLYTIYDAKAEFYMQPFFARNKADALRQFSRGVNDENPNNLIAASPADFTLYEIGDFNEQTGLIEAVQNLISLGSGLEHKAQKQQG